MFYLSDICTLCLVPNEKLQSISSIDTDGTIVKDKLKSVLSEIIQFQPNVPKFICSKCLINLNNVHKFRQSCLENFKKLTKYITQLGPKGLYKNLTVTVSTFEEDFQFEIPDDIENENEMQTDFSSNPAEDEVFNEDDSFSEESDLSNLLEVVIQTEKDSEAVIPTITEETNPEEHEIINNYQILFERFYDINGEVPVTDEDSVNDDEPMNDAEVIKNRKQSNIQSDDDYAMSSEDESSSSDSGSEEETSFKCSRCQQKFPLKSDLTAHRIHVHQIYKKFECNICHKKYSVEASFKSHQFKKHNIAEEFKCTLCPKIFNFKRDWKIHRRTDHQGMKFFKCGLCEKAFKQKNQLVSHEFVHSGGKPFKCRFCDKEYLSNQAVTAHERVHTGELAFKCEKCYRSFIDLSSLKNHSRVHSEKKPSTFKYNCEFCEFQSNNRRKFKAHIRTHRINTIYACEKCPKTFHSNKQLYKHKKTHSNKDHQCSFCAKMFTKKSLVLHERIHTGVRPFKCDVCEESFKQKSVLLIHKKIHDGNWPHKHECEKCHETFRLKKELKIHERGHGIERKLA